MQCSIIGYNSQSIISVASYEDTGAGAPSTSNS